MRRVSLVRSKTRKLPLCDFRVTRRSTSMLDVLMLALACGLFALAIGYTYACERL